MSTSPDSDGEDHLDGGNRRRIESFSDDLAGQELRRVRREALVARCLFLLGYERSEDDRHDERC